MLVAEIEEEARAAGPEVSTEWLGRAVLERLRVLDPVSYLRFASVYKGFEGVADFERGGRRAPEDDGAQAAPGTR